MKKIISVTLLISLLTSCAPKPFVVQVEEPTDTRLNCDQLYSQVQIAQRYKKAAKAEDRFRLRYIFLPIGFLSVYRMLQAEGAAIRRINHLEELSKEKKCKDPALIQDPSLLNPQMLNMPVDTFAPTNGGGQQQYIPYGQPQYATPQGYAPQQQQQYNIPPQQQYAPQMMQPYPPQGQQGYQLPPRQQPAPMEQDFDSYEPMSDAF